MGRSAVQTTARRSQAPLLHRIGMPMMTTWSHIVYGGYDGGWPLG
jgi:hypothetical protein